MRTIWIAVVVLAGCAPEHATFSPPVVEAQLRAPRPLRVAVLSDLNGAYGMTTYGDPVYAAARMAHRTGTSFPGCLETATPDDLDSIATSYSKMLEGSGFEADRIVNKHIETKAF